MCDRFEMDPGEHIRAFRRMRERGEALFAIYHSHPGAPAIPSQRDINGLAYPDAFYLIVSLQYESQPEIRAWRHTAGDLREIALVFAG